MKLAWSDVTPETVFLNRRSLLAGLGAAAVLPRAAQAAAERPNSWDEITSYNNFYEFGFDKGDPAANGAVVDPDYMLKVTVEE